MASFRYKTFGYAAPSAGARLQPFSFERRALHANDVAMVILYAGACHSDLHWARNDWRRSNDPVVPGLDRRPSDRPMIHNAGWLLVRDEGV